MDNPKSPIRFITIAFTADLLACKRVYQKLIKRYEQRPTPSHPTNIWTKFSAVTSINIKNVKKDKYDLKRGKCGSSAIYTVEYTWTQNEIEVTTINMTQVKVSNKKPQ